MPDNDSNSVEVLDLVAHPERERELPKTDITTTPEVPVSVEPFIPEREREQTRGDLARGLLLLLSFSVGGVLLFIGLGRLEGSVLAQSIFPSLIALAGTALGFYFGSQSPSSTGTGPTPSSTPGTGGPPAQPTVVVQQPPVQPPPVQPPVQPGPPEPPVQPPPVQPPVQPGPPEPPVQPPPVQPPVQPSNPEPPVQPGPVEPPVESGPVEPGSPEPPQPPNGPIENQPGGNPSPNKPPTEGQ
jgi:hypothetical protein